MLESRPRILKGCWCIRLNFVLFYALCRCGGHEAPSCLRLVYLLEFWYLLQLKNYHCYFNCMDYPHYFCLLILFHFNYIISWHLSPSFTSVMTTLAVLFLSIMDGMFLTRVFGATLMVVGSPSSYLLCKLLGIFTLLLFVSLFLSDLMIWVVVFFSLVLPFLESSFSLHLLSLLNYFRSCQRFPYFNFPLCLFLL